MDRIRCLAADQAQPAEKLLEAAVEAHLDQLEREAIHEETEAFWEMHDQLVEKYEGRHVAICRGEVVDHDEDASQLARRVREQFGQLAVLIAPVTSEPRRDLRWIGGRVEAKR